MKLCLRKTKQKGSKKGLQAFHVIVAWEEGSLLFPDLWFFKTTQKARTFMWNFLTFENSQQKYLAHQALRHLVGSNRTSDSCLPRRKWPLVPPQLSSPVSRKIFREELVLVLQWGGRNLSRWRGGGGLPGRNGLGASWEETYLLEIFEYYYFLNAFSLVPKIPPP